MNHKSVDFEQLTPMMQHYIQTKDANPDCILFYRLGDFYEMFFEDAEIVSKELELTLTGKSCGLEERAPMCGVPYHAAETYLTRLVQRGYKVAVCEQIEDPKEAKGMVKRAVTRIVTPGTNMDAMSLDESKNNYIMGIFFDGDKYGLSIADVTTADFFVTEVDSNRSCLDEINKYVPSEIICNENFTISGIDIADLKERMQISIAKLDAHYFDDRLAVAVLLEHFHTSRLSALGLPWNSSTMCSLISMAILCSWILRPDAIWNWSRPCGKSKKEVPCSGSWIRPRLPWEQECSVLMSNSP